MRHHTLGLIVVVLTVMIVATLVIVFMLRPAPSTSTLPTAQSESTETPLIESATPAAEPLLPAEGFLQRLTKKPFGLYITPADSPVSPERFSGFHTGADAEYEDVIQSVPVLAIATGEIVLARTASGYGGVLILRFADDDQTRGALYGHLRPDSLPAIGSQVSAGEIIGYLGAGGSAETDGERRHLHFAILTDDRLDIRGYVGNEQELSGWLDPVEWLNARPAAKIDL